MKLRTLKALNRELSGLSLFKVGGTITNELLKLAQKKWKYDCGKFNTKFNEIKARPNCLIWYTTQSDIDGNYKRLWWRDERSLGGEELKVYKRLNDLFFDLYNKETNN